MLEKVKLCQPIPIRSTNPNLAAALLMKLDDGFIKIKHNLSRKKVHGPNQDSWK